MDFWGEFNCSFLKNFRQFFNDLIAFGLPPRGSQRDGAGGSIMQILHALNTISGLWL